jgi:hypothetical protein
MPGAIKKGNLWLVPANAESLLTEDIKRKRATLDEYD